MIKHIALALALVAGPALAQQAPQQSPLQTRIEQQIGALIVQNASLAFQVEQLTAQLVAAQARIREFEEAAKKAEPH